MNNNDNSLFESRSADSLDRYFKTVDYMSSSWRHKFKQLNKMFTSDFYSSGVLVEQVKNLFVGLSLQVSDPEIDFYEMEHIKKWNVTLWDSLKNDETVWLTLAPGTVVMFFQYSHNMQREEMISLLPFVCVEYFIHVILAVNTPFKDQLISQLVKRSEINGLPWEWVEAHYDKGLIGNML